MKMKKLLLSCGLVAFSGAMLATSTFAWFSMNKEVTVTGFEVKASTAGSLVIHTGDNMLKVTTITQKSGDETQSKVTVFTPCTVRGTADVVDAAVEGGTTKISTDFMRVFNSADVDPATGLAKEDKTLTYTSVENTTTETYYKDYNFFVAAAGDEIKDHDLIIELENIIFQNEESIVANDEEIKKVIESDITRAFSVIVYATNNGVYAENIAIADNKIGELDLADFNRNTNPKKLPTVKWENADLGTIGKTAAEGNIHFCFRVYIDGEKLEEAGKTWVRNVNSITANDLTFDLKITAKDKE